MNRRYAVTGIAGGWVALWVLGCGTCNDPPYRGTTLGELGKGVFGYRCADPTDGACPRDGDRPATFPTTIALGASFDVDYDTLGEEVFVDLRSPTSHLRSDGPLFTAVEPGWAALVAYRGDAVFDLVHVQIVEPAELVLDVETTELEVGGQTTFAATLRTDDGEVCAGTVPYEWRVDPPGILALPGDLPDDRPRVTAIGPGVATVSVSDGTREVSLTVEVLPGEVPADTATPTGDTGADTAVGSTP